MNFIKQLNIFSGLGIGIFFTLAILSRIGGIDSIILFSVLIVAAGGFFFYGFMLHNVRKEINLKA